MNQKENKLLVLDDIDISSLQVISVEDYNKEVINSIQFRYPNLRQESKAP